MARRWSDRSEKSLSQLYAEEVALAHLACVLADAMPATDEVRAEVAHAARVPPRTLRDLLNADADIHMRDLARLAHALGLRVRFALEPIPSDPPSWAPGDDTSSGATVRNGAAVSNNNDPVDKER
jgi:hypothetical protein